VGKVYEAKTADGVLENCYN